MKSDLTWVFACGATAAAAVLALAPVARADGDADYVEQLGLYGIQGDANSIGWGHHICNGVAQGSTPIAEAQQLRENSPQLTAQQADGEVNAALNSYCFALVAQGVQLIQIN
jgi:Protein of unknown function (DUF732)